MALSITVKLPLNCELYYLKGSSWLNNNFFLSIFSIFKIAIFIFEDRDAVEGFSLFKASVTFTGW